MSRQVGFKFEKEFVRLCVEKGIFAQRIPKSGPYDVVANGLKIQCKSKSLDFDGRVQIGKGQHLYDCNDYDVLALQCQLSLYLIPSKNLCSKIPGKLKRKIYLLDYHRWKDRWDIIQSSTERQDAPLQKSLF